MNSQDKKMAIVACSGAANTGQTANEVATNLCAKSDKYTMVCLAALTLGHQNSLNKIANAEKIIVVDVRPQSGREIASIPDTIHIPLQEIESRADEVVDAHGSCVVTLCHHGVNSLRAAAVLRHAGVANVVSMAGGIHLWSVDIDPSVPIY